MLMSSRGHSGPKLRIVSQASDFCVRLRRPVCADVMEESDGSRSIGQGFNPDLDV